MVADPSAEINAHKQSWFKNRLKLSTAVRRSCEVSDIAYRVWAELAFGWAWNEPTCFPTYALLSAALGVSRSTIYRSIVELEKHGLVEKRRLPKGNRYLLVTEIPPKFNTDKLNNKVLAAMARQRWAHHGTEPRPVSLTPHDAESEESDVSEMTPLSVDSEVSRLTPSEVSDVTPQVCSELHKANVFIQTEVSDVTPKVDESIHPEKKKYRKGKERREPAAHASSDHSGMTDLGNEDSEKRRVGQMAEADDLLDEGEAPGASRTTRKGTRPRSAEPSFVSGVTRPRTPFPEALGASQGFANIKFDLEAAPPPVEKPVEVLRLLKGEAEVRWGKKASHGFTMELTAEQSGKITNAILRKYPPDVILAMARLIVWDWKVARGVCWPFKKDHMYPTIDAFILYAKELAARIDTGFEYVEAQRGTNNTYHDLFIRRLDYIPEGD